MATTAIPPTTEPATIPAIGVELEEEVEVGEEMGDYKISDEIFKKSKPK